MRVFVYEYLTAMGIGRDAGSPEHGMYREGLAMRDALVADFEQAPGVEVWSFPNEAAPVEAELVEGLVGQADCSLVIAPELDDTLGQFTRLVERHGGRLLGPSSEAVRLTSDKLALAEHWRSHGVPTPATTDRDPTPCEMFPVVWKPRDGAGSTSTFLLRSRFDTASARAKLAEVKHTGPMILQEYVPGRAASVAFLCGPAGNLPLIPTFQHVSDDGRFKYLGGELPIPRDLAERAVRLGQRAVECVPGLLGYVGVDLVLGEAADGTRDFAIEINPRLTTSYVGLRALAEFNVAEAMLRVASGEEPPPFRWKNGAIRFRPDGLELPA